MRINIGCGAYPLEGWLNIDADPNMPAQMHALVPPLPFDDASVDEIWGCHFLEHLTYPRAHELIEECRRVLVPGGILGLVVPDGREIMKRWVREDHDGVLSEDQWYDIHDLDSVCMVFLYCGVNGINENYPHRWLWEARTLARAMAGHGFTELKEINRWTDPRLGSPQWYQCGIEGRKA